MNRLTSLCAGLPKNAASLLQNIRRYSQHAILLAGLAAVIGAPVPVHAQGVEEIVVTARKREESVQDVPLSISVFSGQDIRNAGLKNLEDVTRFAPGVQFNTNLSDLRPGRLYSNMRFRGIEGGSGPLQTAGLFIDGNYVLQAAQSIALSDIERVEIIKGPQSAVFGRNTFAGAINYVTRTPNMQEFAGELSLDAGQYGNYEVSASFEGPLIENKLAMRVGGRGYYKGAQYRASDGGGLGQESSESLYLTLEARPVDAFRVRFRASYQDDDDGPAASALLKFSGDDTSNDTCTGTSQQGLNGAGETATIFPQEFWCGTVPSPGDIRAPLVDSNTNLRPQFPSFQGDLDGDGRDNSTYLTDILLPQTFIRGVPDIHGLGIKRELTRLSLMAEYAFSNDVTATVTASYNENNAAAIRDFDLTPIESWWASNPQTGEDSGYDLRVTSGSDQKFRWMAGYNNFEQEFRTSAGGGEVVHVCGNFAGIATGNFCDYPIFVSQVLAGSDFIDVWSGYGSVSYDITDSLTVDVEGRYQVDKRSDGFSGTWTTYKDFIPRFTVSYKPTNDVTVYGVATVGLLPGVVNGAFSSCSNVPLTEPFVSPLTGELSFSTECEQWTEQVGDSIQAQTSAQTLDSYELGIKSSWFNQRLLVNLSTYYQDWKGQPYGVGVTIVRDTDQDGIPNANFNTLSGSAEGSSKYRGAELESILFITDNWSANLGVSYNKNEFTEFFVVSSIGFAQRLGTNNLKGRRASRFPRWSGSFMTTYERPISAGWTMFTRGDLSYTGTTFTGNGNLAAVDDYVLANAGIGIEKEGLRVELYVRNLFDETKWRAGQNFADFSVVSQTGFDFNHGGVLLIPQDKRTVGIRAMVSF